MILIPSIIAQYDFNLQWASKLVEGLDHDQMTTSPFPGFENHPAFTLGHLVTASALMAEDLGGNYLVPEGWKELFQRKGPGDPALPTSDLKLFPEKNILLRELNKQHEIVKKLLLLCDEKKLNEKIKWRFDIYFPTMHDLVIFMCVSHESMHLGQLSAWRRAMKLPSALSQL
jgi:DinB superfamily